MLVFMAAVGAVFLKKGYNRRVPTQLEEVA